MQYREWDKTRLEKLKIKARPYQIINTGSTLDNLIDIEPSNKFDMNLH